jgi:hypothetical protein
MLIFVAAAFAIFLAPSLPGRGAKTPGRPTTAASTALSPSGSSEIADPWARSAPAHAGAPGLAADAAALAAGEVRDPWAERAAPPPPDVVTVLDVPVDPWAAPPALANAGTAPAPRAGDGLVDPWTRSTGTAAALVAPRAPRPRGAHFIGPPSPFQPAGARDSVAGEVRDPWARRADPATDRAVHVPRRPREKRKSARPSRPPARTTDRDGLRDPWR